MRWKSDEPLLALPAFSDTGTCKASPRGQRYWLAYILMFAYGQATLRHAYVSAPGDLKYAGLVGDAEGSAGMYTLYASENQTDHNNRRLVHHFTMRIAAGSRLSSTFACRFSRHILLSVDPAHAGKRSTRWPIKNPAAAVTPRAPRRCSGVERMSRCSLHLDVRLLGGAFSSAGPLC